MSIMYMGENYSQIDYTVDDTLDANSYNPIANNVATTAIQEAVSNGILATGDFVKTMGSTSALTAGTSIKTLSITFSTPLLVQPSIAICSFRLSSNFTNSNSPSGLKLSVVPNSLTKNGFQIKYSARASISNVYVDYLII